VIEVAGAISAVELAQTQGTRGAEILLLGYPEQGARLSLGVHDLSNNDTTIHASFRYSRKSWQAVVDLLNSGELDLSFVVTHRFALKEWSQALSALKAVGSEPRGKVLLTLNLD
jgi:threonine dehydrogenase-like Zn-dependent dehydrogenase